MRYLFVFIAFIVSVFVLDYLFMTPVGYEEISGEYETLIGRTYKSLIPLNAIGVTFEKNYNGGVDYVFLVPDPGFSGPEVIFSRSLPAGIEYEIVGVFSSRRIFFDDKYCKVKIFGFGEYDEFVVLAPLVGKESGGGLGR